jgi:hypothetical protein
MDQTVNPLVGYAMLDKLLRPFVTHVIEEPANVGVQNPVHALPADAHVQCVQRLMRAASGPKPVGESFEVHLVYRVEDGHHRLLNNLVLHAGDA